MSQKSVIFIQRRSGKSGAPVALSRLLTQSSMLTLHPVLITSAEGWLTEQCRLHNIPCIVQEFPSSRSFFARIFKNRLFVKKIQKQFQEHNLQPSLIVGNDHLEGIFTHILGKAWSVPTAIFLRSSEMKKRDFFKYQCHLSELIYPIGKDQYDRVYSWYPLHNVKIRYDGLTEKDFFSPKPKPQNFPQKILVAGYESPHKGWQDFISAVEILEKDADFPSLEYHFTGKPPILDKREHRSVFKFLGRTENFQELIQKYDLVIHASHRETFGLAMVETLAAGVPLLCSRVGVIEKIQKNPDFLFLPNNPADQAQKIKNLWKNWHKISLDLETCQQNIRSQFMLPKIAAGLVDDFSKLM